MNSAPTFDELVSRYQQHQEMLNRSAHAWRSHRTYLRQYGRFLVENKIDVLTITTSQVRDFQRWLYYLPTQKGVARKVTTQNRTLETIRSFHRFLKDENLTAIDPAAGIERAREPQPLPRNVLTPQEARKVIECPDTKTVTGYRDRTILEILYATGIRKIELMQLTLPDINIEEELLRINGGKGAKDRVVPLSRVACSYLENYLKGVRPTLLRGRTSDRVFISLESTPMGRNTIGEMILKYGRLSGVKKRVTCHLWRHTCATHLLQNRANLRHVQEILGHRSLTTTEKYLHLTITDLKEAHRRFHPREQNHGSK